MEEIKELGDKKDKKMKETSAFDHIMTSYLDSLGDKFLFYKSEDIIDLLEIATMEQKIEICMASITVALGGKTLYYKEKIVLRNCINLPHIIHGNHENFYLMSALGNILLEYLGSLGNRTALQYKELLGGKFLYEGARLNRMSRNRKAIIKAVKTIYNISYVQKYRIIELCKDLLNKIKKDEQEKIFLDRKKEVKVYKPFGHIMAEVTNEPEANLKLIKIETKETINIKHVPATISFNEMVTRNDRETKRLESDFINATEYESTIILAKKNLKKQKNKKEKEESKKRKQKNLKN